MPSRSRTRDLVLSALLAALIAASALVAVPIGEVPFTLQTLMVVLTALVMTPAAAAGAVGTYVLVGAIGVPVFAGGKAGLAVLAGPTGGFLIGFVLGVWAGSMVRVTLESRIPQPLADAAGAVVVLLVTYVCGWVQLAVVTGMRAAPALAAGVLPFIVPDVLKSAGAMTVAGVLRRTGRV